MKGKSSKLGHATLGLAQSSKGSSNAVKHELMKIIKRHVETRKRLKHEMENPSQHHATKLSELHKAHNKVVHELSAFVRKYPDERKHSITILHAAQKKAGVYGALK